MLVDCFLENPSNRCRVQIDKEAGPRTMRSFVTGVVRVDEQPQFHVFPTWRCCVRWKCLLLIPIPFLLQFVTFHTHRVRLMSTRSMISRREMRNVKESMKCLFRYQNKTPTHLPNTGFTLLTESPRSIHAPFHITTKFLSLLLPGKPPLNVTLSWSRSKNFH